MARLCSLRDSKILFCLQSPPYGTDLIEALEHLVSGQLIADGELVVQTREIERLFRRIKRFRRVFTRYDKTDLMFTAFITVALIADILR